MLHVIETDKAQARVFYRRQTSQFLQQQPSANHSAFSQDILKHLQGCGPLLNPPLPMRRTQKNFVVGAYLANANEPCEKEVVKWLRAQNWAVAYSRLLNWQPPQMEFLRVNDESQEVEWFLNNHGVPVVRQVKDLGTEKVVENCPLYVLPATAFSLKGFRLGAGKGFYDCYFTNLRKRGHQFMTIGLCWEVQIMENYPASCHWKAEPHDFKIDFIVSEKRGYSCQQHLSDNLV